MFQIVPFIVALAVILVVIACAGIVILRRLSEFKRTLDELHKHKSLCDATENQLPTAVRAAPAQIAARFDSPVVRLTFQESLDPERFASASNASALAGLNDLLASQAADGVVVSVHSVRLIEQQAELIVSASSAGRRLLKEGKACIPLHRESGAHLPLLTDSRTGAIIEQMKERRLPAVTSKLVGVSTAIVGAAHLVASADLAKRLGRVESKLDVLLASRRIDQLARLERIYTSARELSSQQLDDDRKLELWRLRGELRELRATWRHDFRLKLERIDDPANAAFFRRIFAWQQRSIDGRIRSGISEGEAEVALIEYSMRLEQVLAVGSDTLEEFRCSQESEVNQLDQLRIILQEKAGYISGKYRDISVQPVIDAVSALVIAHRELLPKSANNTPQPAVSGDQGAQGPFVQSH